MAIQGIGYQVRLVDTTIPIRGMHCASCVGTIEHALRNVPGVVQAEVHFGTEQATVTYVPTRVEASARYQAIGEEGYEALANATEADITPIEASKKEEMRDLQTPFYREPVPQPARCCRLYRWYASVVLSLLAVIPPCAALPGFPYLGAVLGGVAFFIRGAGAALKHKTADMNTLIVLGTSAAYVYSVIMTFAPGSIGHTPMGRPCRTSIMKRRWSSSP